jgi:hypothetical protein
VWQLSRGGLWGGRLLVDGREVDATRFRGPVTVAPSVASGGTSSTMMQLGRCDACVRFHRRLPAVTFSRYFPTHYSIQLSRPQLLLSDTRPRDQNTLLCLPAPVPSDDVVRANDQLPNSHAQIYTTTKTQRAVRSRPRISRAHHSPVMRTRPGSISI